MTDVVIRRAIRADLPGIIAMIADDQLGATRESVDDLTPYEAAFEAIDADPNQLLVVADRNGEPIGTLQLTIIPGLSRRGSSRGLVEAVRVAASARGIGLGSTLMEWAIEESVAPSSSSPATSPAPTPTASTTGWASRTATRASNSSSADPRYGVPAVS